MRIASLAWLAPLLLCSCEQIGRIPMPGDPNSPAAPPEDTAAWEALKSKAIHDVVLAPGWGPAELVPGQVNSTGWEDSADISLDGKTLYFAYIPCDFLNYCTKGMGRPDRFMPYRKGPNRGMPIEFAIDVFQSRRVGDAWGPPEMLAVSRNTKPIWQSESGPMEAGGHIYYNSNSPAGDVDFDVDIWRDNERLPFNTDEDESDPNVVGNELFFWSEKRAGGVGNKDIWVTRHDPKADTWSAPKLLPEPVNRKGATAWQPHLTQGGVMLFTSDRDGPEAIYASKREGPESWGKPERLVWPKEGGGVMAVAEPSMTGDGKELYFCVLFRNSAGQLDLDIAFSRATK